MGNGSQDGGLTFYLSERFYDEHKEVLNHLILQFGNTQAYILDAEIFKYLNTNPKGGYIYTTSAPLIAYLRLNGMTEKILVKGE